VCFTQKEHTMSVDLFHNVHKGIRKALFDAEVALGRGDEDGRADAQNALRFTAHHGENEDLLLLPLLEARLPTVVARMRDGHARIDHELHGLLRDVTSAPLAGLYRRLAGFTGRYLEHIAEEEDVVDPAVRGAFSDEDLAFFGAESVARTAPDDARMMLRFMLPALTRDDAAAYLAKLPPALAAELRALR
jgi:hypothetical protein